ncbi:MAG TPA: IS110 family transposase [Polyangiaceae bacterium]
MKGTNQTMRHFLIFLPLVEEHVHLHERALATARTFFETIASVERRATTTETRSFKTHTAALLELLSWLEQAECTHVVMEATGVYWKPVWHILSGPFELVLANAKHVRNVPGRKTDVKDAEWLANLLAHGLISASCVPPAPIQELRDLTRTRKQFVRQRVQHVNRIQKILEDANIKLSSFISDITGVSGRAMLEAMIAGESDPRKLAELGDRRLKAPRQTLELALQGRLTPHHRFLLQTHLEQVDMTDRSISHLDARIEEATSPFDEMVGRLCERPGMSKNGAHIVLAEIGQDMSRFPNAAHLVSFAGLCPRLDESAGKRRSTRIRKGSNWLKSALVSCTWAAARAKKYLRAGSIPPHQNASWLKEGHHSSGSLDAHRDLPYALQAQPLSRSRSPAL